MEAKEEQSERQFHRSSRCHGSSLCNSLLWAFSSSSSSLTKHAVAKCGKLLLTSDVFDGKRSRQTLATSLPHCYTWFSPCQPPCFELSRQILYSCLKLANANLRASTSSSHVGAWWCHGACFLLVAPTHCWGYRKLYMIEQLVSRAARCNKEKVSLREWEKWHPSSGYAQTN